MRLLHNVEGQLHGSMARPAKHRAVADKGTRLGRRESNFAGFSFSHFDLDAKFFEPDAMWDIVTFQSQYNSLAFLQSDFSGCEVESLCGYFDAARRGLGTTLLNQRRRCCQQCRNYDRKSDPKFQVDLLNLSFE